MLSWLVVLMQLETFRGWLAAKLKQQGKLSADKTAAVTSLEIKTQVEALRKPFTKLKNKKKPPPPPPPVANTTAANTTTKAGDHNATATEQPDTGGISRQVT